MLMGILSTTFNEKTRTTNGYFYLHSSINLPSIQKLEFAIAHCMIKILLNNLQWNRNKTEVVNVWIKNFQCNWHNGKWCTELALPSMLKLKLAISSNVNCIKHTITPNMPVTMGMSLHKLTYAHGKFQRQMCLLQYHTNTYLVQANRKLKSLASTRKRYPNSTVFPRLPDQ